MRDGVTCERAQLLDDDERLVKLINVLERRRAEIVLRIADLERAD